MSTQHSAELRNSSYILRLPEEIFVAVIALSVNVHAVDYRKQINNLRRVCRSWNEVIRHTPRFWVTIKDTDGPNWTSLALKFSVNQPLDIRYGTYGDLGCLPLLLPHVHRFKSFHLRIPPDSTNLPEEIRTTPAPKLIDLSLSAWEGASMIGQPDETSPLFAGQVSQIQSLSVDYVSIPWDGPFASLERLKLQKLYSSAPSISQLFDILAACPRINSLEIRDVKLKNDGRPLAERITLPRLKTFITAFLLPSDVQAFCLRLHLPECTHLELGCMADFVEYETHFLNLLKHLPDSQIGGAPFKSVGFGRSQVYLDYRRFRFQLKGLLGFNDEERSMLFLLWAQSFDPVRIVPDIAALWGGSVNGEAGVDVDFNFGGTNESVVGSRLAAICSSLPKTKRLIINYNRLFPASPSDPAGPSSLGPLHELVDLEQDGQRYSRRWRLPKLHRITVSYSDQIAPHLLGIVRRRMMSRDAAVAPAARLKLIIVGDQSEFAADVLALKDICEDVEFVRADQCPDMDTGFTI